MRAYVLRRPRPAALVPLLGLPVLAVLVFTVDWPVPPSPLLAVGVAFVAFSVWQATVLVRVDGSGVRLNRRPSRRELQPRVPWSSIHEVALTETDPPELEVRLKLGAPLPQGVAGAVHDPALPYVSPPELRMAVPGADRSALAAAVQGFGGVPLRSA